MNDMDLFKVVGIRCVEKRTIINKQRCDNIPIISIVFLFIIIMGCICADFFVKNNPSYLDLLNCLQAPNRNFIFGTDNLGRDVFSCIWYGGRVSLFVGFFSTLISTFIAIVYGTLSGIAPEWLDNLMMRLTEIFLSVPNLLVIIFIQAILGNANIISISVVVGITSWYSIAKIIRTEVRQIRNSEYVIASKCMGAGFVHMLYRHFCPNFISSIMFMVIMNIRAAIISESTLSFLGIGLPLEIVSWGSMMSLSENALMTRAWWIIIIPGLFLVTIIMCMTNIGNWLRKKVNQKEDNL